MDLDKAISLIENSFLSPLLNDPDVTDISYNGQAVFYQHNFKGRQKSDIQVDPLEVSDFVRQISNISEQFFSVNSPILDVSIGRYRVNAVHPVIARIGNDKCINLCIRIASNTLKIQRNSGFLDENVYQFLKLIIRHKQSIIIGGLTSSGKTEFQKFLITLFEANSRAIIIDNVLELDQMRFRDDIDINSWKYDDRNSQINISLLVKNALRSNPDWLIVAEARGAEMIDVLNAAMTGNPIITTIHAENAYTLPSRMISMVMMNEKKMSHENIFKDICSHIHFYIYLKKEVGEDGTISRKVHQIIYLTRDGRFIELFSRNTKLDLSNLPKEVKKQLEI